MDSSSSLKGIELGKLVLSSGLLDSSWRKIQKSNDPNQDSALGFKIHDKEEKFPIVVFTAPPISSNSFTPTLLFESRDPNPFPFLRSEKFPSFSVHTPAFELFASNENLPKLKTELLELLKSKPVIITGAALGGCIASLFTLWLLETIDPKRKLKRPLCITFGAPLIGDASLQQILENSVRSSCFLHVADAAKNPITTGLAPIGTFLICFESECFCIEDPEAVMELLLGGATTDFVDYGEVLHRLDQSVFSMADSRLKIPDGFIERMEDRAWKMKNRFDPARKLNDMKIAMMYVEDYKKEGKKAEIGYYDRYRSKIPTLADTKIEGLKKELNLYWKSLVEEVEKKPQSDVSNFTRRYLYSGNNYRRLVEPLDIAEYYREGGKEYETSIEGRLSSHYVMLEKWFGKESIKADKDEKRDLSHLLTFDSCFWAKVEEAMIVINHLKAVEGKGDEVLTEKLKRFEEYVWEMIGTRAVSPEIFLEKSSFMSWWKEYKEIKGRNGFNSSPSEFTEFMNSGTYKHYGVST